MDSIIEDKIIEILTAATMDDVEDNVVVNIEQELGDWDQESDYPSIVISCNGWSPISWQVGAVEKEYVIFVAILVMKPTTREAKEQRTIIQNRAEAAIRHNQQLISLTDATGKEHAYQMELTDVRFAHAGFDSTVQAVAHFRITVKTNRVGPF
jgi:hypothetical protein